MIQTNSVRIGLVQPTFVSEKEQDQPVRLQLHRSMLMLSVTGLSGSPSTATSTQTPLIYQTFAECGIEHVMSYKSILVKMRISRPQEALVTNTRYGKATVFLSG